MAFVDYLGRVANRRNTDLVFDGDREKLDVKKRSKVIGSIDLNKDYLQVQIGKTHTEVLRSDDYTSTIELIDDTLRFINKTLGESFESSRAEKLFERLVGQAASKIDFRVGDRIYVSGDESSKLVVPGSGKIIAMKDVANTRTALVQFDRKIKSSDWKQWTDVNYVEQTYGIRPTIKSLSYIDEVDLDSAGLYKL